MRLEFTNREQEELFNNNIGFAKTIADGWTKKCEMDRDELHSYALEGLCKAAIKYDVNKCDKFLNYAAVIINMTIKRELKARNTQKSLSHKGTIGFEDMTDSFTDENDNIEYNALIVAIDQILITFPETHRQAIKKYLIDKMTLKQLSEEYGVSMRTIHKWVIKGREEIMNKIK